MMPVNFSEQVYEHTQDLFGRVIVVTPLKSNPGGAAYQARGILEEEAMDVEAIEGAVFSESRIILDIREAEFAIQPLQGDLIDVPADSDLEARGQFEVIDTDQNGGGETTLTLRHIVETKP